MSNLFDESSLAMIPTAYKEDKLYSLRPTDGSGDFTFSRGSNLAATRVGADGLIEKGRENIVLYSNKFDESYWGKLNGCSIVGKTATDPFGIANNAWLVSFNGTSNARLEKALSGSSVKTMSIYVRTQSGTQDVIIGFGGSELSTFTATTTWQRIEKFTPSNIYPRLRCDSATTLEVFGFQAELGLVATDYIETGATTAQAGILEDTPRFDYSGGATCPSLLLEPSRTNPLPQSEYIYAGGGYNFTGSSVVTYNAATSPEGVQNAALFNFPVNNAGFYNFTTGGNKSVGDKITMSLFAKLKLGSSTNIIKIGYGGTSVGGDKLSEFNLSTGIVTYTHPSVDSAIIEDYGNGWYRLIQTQTCIAAGNAGVVAYGAGNIDAYVWGVQSEDASYATSYIPTYGVSQTRANEDTVQVNNMLVSGVTTSGAWSLFFDISKEADNAYDGDNSIIVRLFNSSADLISVRKYYEGQEGRLRFYSNLDVQTISYLDTSNKKWCMVVDDKEIKLYSDGSLKHTANLPSSHNGLDDIVLQYGSSERTSTNYSSVLVFPTALTDSECIALTTI